MGTTLKDAADDAAFIAALKVLDEFATKEALNQKADASSVTNKADQNYVDTELEKKADASALRDLTLEKALPAQAVATQLLSTAKTKDDLGKAILGVTKEVDGTQQSELETNLAANPGLQTAVKNALASDRIFQDNVKITVNCNEPGFQGSVREVMSKPVFEIPADDNAPLSWDW